MSVYLTIFSKLRYLGLAEIDDAKIDLKNKLKNNLKNNLNEQKNCGNCGDCEKNTHEYVDTLAVVNTMRGLELAILHGMLVHEQQTRYEKFCFEDNAEQLKGPEPMLQRVEFVRLATPEDLAESARCQRDEGRALVRAREILTEHNLYMKLVDVEYVLDRKKLFFYFTSDQRVDFRAYVRDLAREFKTRIEMRQIGVRDEARAVKGISSCGRPCCCSYWLHHFSPICMKMVKEQKLALNPAKISGICGRLMCCIAYEQPNYEELWDKLPPPGTKIKSGDDFYTVESISLGTESVNIRYPSGQYVSIPIKDFENFNAIVTSGGEWGIDTDVASSSPSGYADYESFESSDGAEGLASVGEIINTKMAVNNNQDNKNKNVKNIKDFRDFKGVKDIKDVKNVKDVKDNRDNRDNRDKNNDNKKAVKFKFKKDKKVYNNSEKLDLEGVNNADERALTPEKNLNKNIKFNKNKKNKLRHK